MEDLQIIIPLGPGYHYNDTWDMVFDCYEATNLKSIEVYAETNFSSTIEILDNGGNQVMTPLLLLTQD